MSLSTMTVTSAMADMFADYYRLDKEKAAVGVAGAGAGFEATSSVFWGATSGRVLGVDSRGGPVGDRCRQRTAAPTTNPPETPGSMSSEHSFMATSAPAPQPPALAAQPGLPPYVSAGASAGASTGEEQCSPAAGTQTRNRTRRRRATRLSGDSARAGPARVSSFPHRLPQRASTRVAVPARASSEQTSRGDRGAEAPSEQHHRTVRATMLTARSLPRPQSE